MDIESNIEDQIREAILGELERQAAADSQALSLSRREGGKVEIRGTFNIDDLALAVTGALAGGP